MKKIVTLLFAIAPFITFGQLTADKNYVHTVTYTVPVQEGQQGTVNDDNKLQTITYFDGMGRPLQNIGVHQGGNSQSIIKHYQYDALGRQAINYLPYATDQTTTNHFGLVNDALQKTNTFYNTQKYEHTTNPYIETEYEKSSLSRTLKQAAHGNDWNMNMKHTLKLEYTSNPDDDVKKFSADYASGSTEATELVFNGYYNANELFKTIVKDENWLLGQAYIKDHTTEEYKDKLGRVVLQRTFNENQAHDTYYVYDNYGNLTYVLPPAASEVIVDEVTTSGTYTAQTTTFPASDLLQSGTALGSVIAGIIDMGNGQFEYSISFNVSRMTGNLKTGDVITLPDAENVPDSFLFLLTNFPAQDTYNFSIVNGKIHVELNGTPFIMRGIYGTNTFILPAPTGGTTYTLNENVMTGLGYQYAYDYRNRLIETKTPGKGKETIVYDGLDRPILTQNAKQSLSDEWLFTKYDVLGRVVYTGIYVNSSSRQSLQTAVDSQSNAVWYETKQTSNSNLGIVYSNNAYPTVTSQLEVLTLNFYDDYQNIDMPGLTLVSNASVLGETITVNTKTLATASKVKVLETNDWIHYIIYYDKNARPIYVASKNEYLNTVDIVENKLDFAGTLLQSKKTHTKDSNAPIVVDDVFTYDHALRLLTQTQTIDSNAPELIVLNGYDELGRIENKKVGGLAAINPEQSSGLQTVDYTFNIRGWLKTINNGTTSNGDVFGFKLNYNNTELTGAKALYNGNISETHFKSANDNKLRSYDYAYDGLNRLKNANYHGNYTVPGLTVVEDYSLSNISYDKNGNITALERKGLYGVQAGGPQGIATIDNLTYIYAPLSNQLSSVGDTATQDGFKDGNTIGDDYQHDVNGNLVSDKNKGITNIAYNYLDLPVRITFHNNNSSIPEAGIIEYVYDALGTKLKKYNKQASASNGISSFYIGNMVYEQSGVSGAINLQFIGHAEGYAEPDGQNGYDYIYQYKDHLGNIRVSYSDFDGNGSINAGTEIVQAKNYYPFGLDHNYGANSSMSVINGRNHKWKYNGQEHDEAFGLNVTEMTFRQYDMTLGRFHSIDKLAYYDYGVTPYHFGLNNPIYFSDPSGLTVTTQEIIDLAFWVLGGGGGESNDALFDAFNATYGGGAGTEVVGTTGAWGEFGFDGGFTLDSNHEILNEVIVKSVRGSNWRNFLATSTSINSALLQIQTNILSTKWYDYLVESISSRDESTDRTFNLALGSAGFPITILESWLQKEKNRLSSRGTITSNTKIRKFINPSLSKLSKVTNKLGVAGAVYNGITFTADVIEGKEITASRIFDTALTVTLSIVAISNPVALIGIGLYALGDAYGVFDGIKESLGGNTVLINGN